MADELTLNCDLRFAKGGTDFTAAVASALKLDVAGNNFIHNRQTVGTSEEALLLGDAGAGGYLIGVNRDATNYMEIRPATGVADLVRLNAGDVCLFRLTGTATAPYVIADTADVEFEYWLIEA